MKKLPNFPSNKFAYLLFLVSKKVKNYRYNTYELFWFFISFSFLLSNQTAAAEMESAIKKMEDEGVQSYILDLRNNPVSVLF